MPRTTKRISEGKTNTSGKKVVKHTFGNSPVGSRARCSRISVARMQTHVLLASSARRARKEISVSELRNTRKKDPSPGFETGSEE